MKITVGGCAYRNLAWIEKKFRQMNRKSTHQKVTKYHNTNLAQEVPECRWMETSNVY